jgi:hypothetical protein
MLAIPRDLITRGGAYRTRSRYLPGVDWEPWHSTGEWVVFAKRRGMQQARLFCKQYVHPTPVSRYSILTNAGSASSSNAQASKVGPCVSSIESRGCYARPGQTNVKRTTVIQDACLRSLSLSALTRRAAFEIDARVAKNGLEGL